MQLYTLTLPISGVNRKVLSLLDVKEFSSSVQLSKALIGYFKDSGAEIVPDAIVINPDFARFFHQTVVFASMQSMQLMQAAEMQKEGFVYVIDRRGEKDKESRIEDVIGSFEVQQSTILPDSYEANVKYQFISDRGIFQLPDTYEKILLTALSGFENKLTSGSS